MRRVVVLLIVSFLPTISLCAQVIARFEVEAPANPGELEIPVSAQIDKLTSLSDSELALKAVEGGKKVSVPFQINISGDKRELIWLVKFESKDIKKVFELSKGKTEKSNSIIATKDDKNLTISANDKNLLRYVHGMTYPPAGVDSAYRRSGFIHPLWTPHGQELTRIQPPDHYHHYGIWNPWTHVLYKGDTIDFWNIGGKKGTVRFARFNSMISGQIFSEVEALHEHVVTKKNAKEEVAITERQIIRVYRPEPGKDYYVVDFTSEMTCATDDPVTLLQYRYGGFGWRTTEQWNNKNSEVLTSEGKSRKEADGSLARWCIVQGELGADYGGVVMMSNPSNYNHPEPLRIWPENQYNRGDMFANFSPTKNKDWLLEPGKTYTLHYRLLVFNGKMMKENAERAWQGFAHPPIVTVKK
jgi:hypothetical protein